MWPGPEGGGLERGGGSDPSSCALSIPDGGLPDPSDPSQRLSDDRVQKSEDQRKQTQPQGSKSRLALIQSRTKSKRESALIRSNEKIPKGDQADSSKQSDGKNPNPADRKRQSNKANKGKVNMVREQLEQNRLRFERRGQELNETAKTMEVKLEHLRQQLEERDVSIQQLQSGEIPPVESQPEPVNFSELLKERDAKIAELTQKAADLENTILDMQENLKEKDAVIEARTQAITLLSDDLSKKRKTTVDTLEETRQQMKIMQENFVGIEAGLTAEIEQLTKALEAKNQKLQQLEFNLAQAEEVRVELMVRNAELEEKLTLSSSQPGESVEELKSKLEELTNLLDEANKKGVALQAEKKALNKQLKSLKKESNANEEIVKLQNHVAELEEEKASESAWQKRVEELEIKLKQQGEDLENHVHMITLLESDKLEVMASLEEQTRELDELRSYVSELEKGKSPETRAVDFEESWSVVQPQKSDDSALLQELSEASRRLAETEKRVVEQDDLIQELKSKLAQMAADRDNQQSALDSLPTRDPEDQESIISELKQELKESKGAFEEWKLKSERIEAELESVSSELKRKEKVFSELEEKHSMYEQSLSFRVEDAERDLQNRKLQIKELESFVRGLAVQLLKGSLPNDGSPARNSTDESLMEKNMDELESELSGMVSAQQVERRSSVCEERATRWNMEPNGEQTDEDIWKWDTFESVEEQPASNTETAEPSHVSGKIEVHTPPENQYENQHKEDDMLQKNVDSLRRELQERDSTVLDLHKLLEEKSNLIVELNEQLHVSSLSQEEQRMKILEAETMIEKLRSQLVSQDSPTDPNVQSEELIALKGALELKNEECQRLETKLRTQAEKLKKVMVNLKAKTVANNDLTDKVTKLQAAIESNQAQLDNLSKDKNEILEKWQTESLEKVEVINALESVKMMLEEREQEIFELKKQVETKDILLAETKGHLDDKIVEIGELEANLSEKVAQLAAIESRLATTDVKETEEVVGDTAAKDAQITKLQNVAKSYKVKLAKEKKAHQEVEEKLTSLEQTLAEKSVQLEEALEKLSQHNHAYEAKVQEYEAYVDSLKQELDRERQQLCHLSESFADTEHRCKDLENYCRKLEQQVGEAHQQGANELENELNRRRHEAEDRERSMVRELHSLRDENKELSRNLSETELKVKALQMELCAAVGQVSEMTKESERRAVWEEEVNMAADDVRNLETKIKNMSRDHKQQLDDLVAETNQVRESLQNELDDAREHLSKLEAEMNVLRDQLSVMSRAEQELIQDIQQKEAELEEMRQLLSAVEAQRKQQVAEMTADLEMYKRRVSELEATSTSTAHLFPDLVDEPSAASAASARISELNTTVEALTGELEMMKARKKSECQDVIDERPSIPQELDTHVTEIQLMTSLNSMVQELEAELNQVWSERDQALAQIDQLMNNSVARDESFTSYNMDESLMEKNMNQLESELSGMVTSQQDGVQKPCVGSVSSDGGLEPGWSMETTGQSDADVWKWDAARPEHLKEKFSVLEQRIKKKLSRMSLQLKQGTGDSRNVDEPVRPTLDEHTAAEDRYQKLTTQVKELESERNDAFSQIKLLRSEMDKLTSSMEKGLPLGESSVAPTPTIESAPGWEADDPDGWGWGDKTEDEIREPVKPEVSASEQLAALQTKLNAHESEREQWETEKAKLAEDLKLAQVRSMKLTKKLKEMKQKYETSKVSTSSTLDQALEEEFLIQIKNLEKDLTEAQTELTSIRDERDNLAKQVQVLTNANERLVEMKERQDFEVEMWQKRSDDLTKKVNALEWEIAELKNEKTETAENPFEDSTKVCQKCGELEKQLALLSEESEALQALLTKQKEDQLLVGKSGDMNPIAIEQLMKETHTWSSKYETLMQEYQQVRAQCIADTEKINKMDTVVAELTGAVERLENEKKYLQDVHDSLKMEFESVNAQLRQTQEVLIRERNAREGELSTRHMEENLLREKYQEVCTENEEIRDRCRKLEDEVKMMSEATANGTEIDQLKYHLSAQAADLSAREQHVEKLNAEISDLKTRLQSAIDESSSMQSERSRLTDEINALRAENNVMQGRLESEITQLRNQVSEHVNMLRRKEQDIERLEAELLDSRTCLKTAVDQTAPLQTEQASVPVSETSAVAIVQSEVRSTADWFSSHSGDQGHHVGTPPTSVLNWDAILSGTPNQAADVFDTIVTKTDVSVTTQAPPAPAFGFSSVDFEAKEAELQKMTRLVETLKLTHSEAEQEWNQAMEYTKSQLQTAVDELERVKEVLSVRERELCECREAFERSSHDYQDELAKRDKELKSIESQIETLQADIYERERRLRALEEGEFSQLQLQLAEKDQLLLQVQAKRDHDLSEANQQIADLKTKLSQKEWQMTEITMARERELAMRDEAKGKELKEQIAEKDQQLSEERQRLQAQIEALQMTADQQAATIHQLQSQFSTDSPALEEMRRYAEEQSKTIEDLRNQIEVINQELNDTRQYSHQQANTLQSLQHHLQANEDELARLRSSQQKLFEVEEEIEGLREKVSNRETTIERLQACIREIEQERASWRSRDDFEQLESNLLSKEQELSLLRQELLLKEEFVVKLQAEVQAKDTEVQELQDKIQRLEMKRMWDAEVKANREAAAKLEMTALAGGDAANKGIRSDLDQALNMLHQRDVRCEELTLELMRLLEERDSLQLRLSSALRINEDLRSKLKQYDVSPNVSVSPQPPNQGLYEPAPTMSSFGLMAVTDVSVDAEENMHGLANKLAELKRVGYNRDVRIKDESELRHKEQMKLMTSSPSMLLPPSLSVVSSSNLNSSSTDFTTVEGTGAAVDLVASNSDAQDEQSTSLLDWFWGRR